MNFLSWLLENDTNGWHLICLSTRPYFTSLVKQTVIITSGTVHFLSLWGMEDSNSFANADKPCSFQERVLPHHILWKNNSHWWVVFGPNCLPLIYFTGGPLHQAITLENYMPFWAVLNSRDSTICLLRELQPSYKSNSLLQIFINVFMLLSGSAEERLKGGVTPKSLRLLEFLKNNWKVQDQQLYFLLFLFSSFS